MALLALLKGLYQRRQTAAHRAALARSAVIGDGFCAPRNGGPDLVRGFHLANLTGSRDRVRIGRNCSLLGSLLCDGKGSVEIGDFVYANTGASFRVAHGLRIGSHCLFGPQVTVADTDSHALSRRLRHADAELIPVRGIDPYQADGGPIEIGTDVWVCMGALLFGGIRVGDGAIIAARSVVTRDVPPMSIVAGCPARVIGEVPE